jgi:hypothetical protein
MDSQLFNQAFNDLRGALDAAAEPVRKYERKTDKPLYKPDNARFKLVIWFKDGNTRYYYSFDHVKYKDGTFIDEHEAIKKLIRLVNKYNGQYKNAIIYANLDEKKAVNGNYNCEVFKSNIYGNFKMNEAGQFFLNGKNTIFDFSRILQLNKYRI